MHYVMGDIHNELHKLKSVLKQIHLTGEDELIVLGDLFDRGGLDADPVGVYFTLLGIPGKWTWIRGNHDQWLADYIKKYYSCSERKRAKMPTYSYNSFELMRQRLTEVDMLHLAELIDSLSLQKELEIDGKKYLFAHAMTSQVGAVQDQDYYLMGTHTLDDFFLEGIEGAISMCGHTPTADALLWDRKGDFYLDTSQESIWRNEKGNVYLLDCGCGFGSGRLACMCIETGVRFYSEL